MEVERCEHLEPKRKGHGMSVLEHKVPPLVVVAAAALLMWAVSAATPALAVDDATRWAAAALFLAAGASFCIAGVLSFRRARTTVDPVHPENTSSLVTTGIYRVSRNPMYVGFALVLAAWAVYLASPLSLIGLLFFILYMNRFQIIPEERMLGELFGDEFVRYRSMTRRWL
jgi:protein-S-isoprenylcysteine O-methyltransferase Ste14